jgi:hypothetical protein
MRVWFRLLLVAVLAAAIPLKGLAAVGAWACPHGTHGTHSTHGTQAVQTQDQASDDAPPCHQADSQAADKHSAVAKANCCGSCSPCCAAAAPWPTLWVSLVAQPAQAPPCAHAVPLASATADVPLQPPRTSPV